jgi:hypothetical protein
MWKLRIGVLLTSAALALSASPAASAAGGTTKPVKTAIGHAIRITIGRATTITRARSHRARKARHRRSSRAERLTLNFSVTAHARRKPSRHVSA